MIDTSDFRNGLSIQLDGQIYQIVEFQHVKPGKGGAFVRTKLRNVRAGTTVERTFRADEKVEQAVVDKREYQLTCRRKQRGDASACAQLRSSFRLA